MGEEKQGMRLAAADNVGRDVAVGVEARGIFQKIARRMRQQTAQQFQPIPA